MDNVFVRLHGGVFLFSQNRFQPELQVTATQGQPLSSRAEGHRVVADILISQALDDGAGRPLPDNHDPPQTPGRQEFTIGTEGDRGHAVAMSAESSRLAPRLQVPEPYGRVV